MRPEVDEPFAFVDGGAARGREGPSDAGAVDDEQILDGQDHPTGAARSAMSRGA